MDAVEIFRGVRKWISAVDPMYTEDVRENNVDEVAMLFSDLYEAMVGFACAESEANYEVTTSVAEAFALAWAKTGTHDPMLIRKMRPDAREIVLTILERTQSEELKKEGFL